MKVFTVRFLLLRPDRVQSIVINPSVSVCSVCVSVCLRGYLWNRRTDLHELFMQIP